MLTVLICMMGATAALWLQLRFNLFSPRIKGLPVLMYHKVSEDYVSGTSVTIRQLGRQFDYLVRNNYSPIRLADLLNPGFTMPKNPILITFDDGYLNNFELLYPMLIKYRLKASIMLPVNHIGLHSSWETEQPLPLMDYHHLLRMANDLIEFSLHSFDHSSYKTLTPEEVSKDLDDCFRVLNDNNIPFVPVLAYPYGAYPRKQPEKNLFFLLLQEKGIRMGLRIGNRINRLPINNPYEVKRIDIKGTDSFWSFKTKLKKGRVRMF